jgi:adenylate cyclase
LDGRERHVVVMFVDLRGSTTLGEAKMPFDMLFILHRFFQQMTRALATTGGHYSNFTGDGLMALYGLKGSDSRKAVTAALAGAREMTAALDRLNAELAAELTLPLRMGIGIHFGEAIVGTMGPPGAQIVSAIGDTVNTAARLEGLTKEHDCSLILSLAAAEAGRLAFPGVPRHQVVVKGRVEPVEFLAFPEVPAA